MYTDAYKLIKQRLSDIPSMKLVELYLKQYNNPEAKGILKNTPATFVEFLPSEMIQMARGIQKTTAKMNIHLVTYNVHTSDKRIKKGESLNHMAIFDAVFKALNSKGGMLSGIVGMEALMDTDDDCRLFTSIKRINITPAHDLKKQMVSIQQFEGVFYDHSGSKNFTNTNPTLDILIEN